MKTSDFDYTLPPELIAQEPLPERSASRMMVVHRDSGVIEHRHITDLSDYLNRGDLLVLNNTRVIPARIFGYKMDTGGKVELLLVEKVGGERGEGQNDFSGRMIRGLEVARGEKKVRMILDRMMREEGSRGEYEEEWVVLCRAGWKPRPGILLSLAQDLSFLVRTY